MIRFVLLVTMLFLHIVDDYYLQGILASMKQRKWWQENAPCRLYSKDYLMALAEHAFSWTFMVHLPAFVYASFYGARLGTGALIVLFFITWIVHAMVDNAKANAGKINLIEDQIIHIFQVIIVWLIYV